MTPNGWCCGATQAPYLHQSCANVLGFRCFLGLRCCVEDLGLVVPRKHRTGLSWQRAHVCVGEVRHQVWRSVQAMAVVTEEAASPLEHQVAFEGGWCARVRACVSVRYAWVSVRYAWVRGYQCDVRGYQCVGISAWVSVRLHVYGYQCDCMRAWVSVRLHVYACRVVSVAVTSPPGPLMVQVLVVVVL
jgi:hypothetical protein